MEQKKIYPAESTWD